MTTIHHGEAEESTPAGPASLRRMSELGRAVLALRYAAARWLVFPLHSVDIGGCTCRRDGCTNPGKHPKTQHGFKDATRDAEQIKRWFAARPFPNVGVRTGSESGLVVLDIDPAAGGEQGLSSLQNELGPLSPTLEAATGGGGRHLFFRHPGIQIPCSARSLAPGVDVRGDGGYVVAPPSMHASGAKYAWAEGRLAIARIQQLPQSWIDRMSRGSRRAQPASRSIEQEGPIPKGERNNTLTSIAGSVRRDGASESKILDNLRVVNRQRCIPPLEDEELRKIAASVASYPPACPASRDEWPDPVPLSESVRPPVFPLSTAVPDSLHTIREFLAAVAESLQVPVDMPAMLLPPVVAVAGAQKFEVNPRHNWKMVCALWTLVLLPPGERKSQTITWLTTPLYAWEKSEKERLQPEIALATTRRALNEQTLRQLTSLGTKQGQPVTEERVREIAELQRKLDADAIPQLPRIVTTEPTPEAIAALLVANNERLLIACAEADALDVMFGRYSRGVPNMGVLLSGYSGDPCRYDRRHRPPDLIDRPALSIALAVQPAAVVELLRNRQAEGRGFLGRLLFALPCSMLGARRVDPEPVPSQLEAEYNDAIRRLLELPINTSAGPITVKFDDACRARFTEFEMQIERALKPDGRLGDATDWGGKHCGAIARVALALHLLEMAIRNDFFQAETLRLHTLEAAIGWSDYLIAHREAVFANVGLDPNIRIADRIVTWLRNSGEKQVKRQQLWQQLKDRRHVSEASDLDAPIDLLIEQGYLRPITDDRDGPRKSKAKAYEVNPKLQFHRMIEVKENEGSC